MVSDVQSMLANGRVVLAATWNGISRSSDGGATWSTVLGGVVMDSLTRSGSGFLAIGRRGSQLIDGPAIVAMSADGISWRTVVTRPSHVAELGTGEGLVSVGSGAHHVLIAVPDIASGYYRATPLRSVDDGRTWARIDAPLSTGISVLAADGTTVYATGTTSKKSCAGAVYRSNDAGLHWKLLNGSCLSRPLYAVDFVDPLHGYAAGGTPEKFGGSDVVEATDDGGRTWSVRWTTPFDPSNYGGGGGPDNEIVRLAFVDRDRGYAMTGGCTMGQNGPCGGHLYLTSDAGHHWARADVVGLSIAVDGAHVYVGGSQGGPALTISANAGRSWSRHDPADRVTTQPVAGTGGSLSWQTSLGMFLSSDAGLSWSLPHAPALAALPPYAGPVIAAPPHNLLAIDGAGTSVWSSTDDGVTATTTLLANNTATVQAAALAPDGAAAAIVGRDDTCIGVDDAAKVAVDKPGWTPETRRAEFYQRSAGSSTWRKVTTLPFLTSYGRTNIAMSRRLIVVRDACGIVERSTDGGTTWGGVDPGMDCALCSVAVSDSDVWLQALGTVAHSADGGDTWSRFHLDEAILGADSLAATGPGAALITSGGSLWRTTDGGAHWSQSWPSLAGES